MSSKVALIIGVKRTKGLIELPGAIEGALRFDAWAKRYGYSNYLCTDDDPDFGINTLKLLVLRIVENCPERFVIYFAGHGCEPTAGQLIWLLPEWHKDSNEAVNLGLSIYNAQRSGIAQIGIFADTCRTQIAGSASATGSSIFPKDPRSIAYTHFDRFLAVGPESSAQEIRGGESSYGIFSKCLLLALSGEAEEAFDGRQRGPGRRVVSASLAKYLIAALPEECARIRGAEIQKPEVSVGWMHPHDIYYETEENPIPSLYF